MAGASTRDSFGRNASRNLHSYVHKTGKTLAVKVTGVKGVPIKGTSKYKKPGVCTWPVRCLSDWIKTSFQNPYQGCFMLGGHKLETELPAIKTMLRQFWERYHFIDGLDVAQPEKTLPFYLHGDEGRGQVRRPVMVISFQPVLSACGSEHLNSGKTLVCFIN
jgi:hypothetical protein